MREAALEHLMNEKVDAAIFNLEVRNMHDHIARVETLSQDAVERSMNHICHQSEAISEIRQNLRAIHATVNSWKNIKVAVVITVLLAILSGALFLFRVTSKQDMLSAEMSSMKEDLDRRASRDDKVLETLRGLRDNVESMVVQSQQP